jgi:trimethylamine---corrinoid protein Co-methyltransferase
MIINNYTKLRVLPPQQVDLIHRYSLLILNEIGVVFRDERALDALDRAGALVDRKSGRVRIPGKLVQESLTKCQKQFTLHGRNPKKTVVIGGDHQVFAPGYGSPFVIDLEGKRRSAELRDFQDFARMAGWAEEIDCTGGVLVEPQDLPVENRHLDMLYTLISSSDKPTMGMVSGEVPAQDTMEMMSILFGGKQVLREKPVVLGLINVNSPLAFDGRMLEALLTYAANRQPVILAPFVMAGASGPITLSDALAQHNAEFLAGMVLAQTVSEGTPLIYGCASAILDMRYGSPAIGSPESALFVSATLQMADHYGLPSRAGGTLSDAKTLDVQSGYEKMLLGMTTVLSGANFVLHMAGILDSYLTMSFSSFMVDLEIIAFIKKFMAGIQSEEIDKGLQLIAQVGPAGNFLDNEHTFAHYQQAFYQPTLSERNAYETWQDKNSPSVADKAIYRVKKVLAEYAPPSLEPELEKALREFIERRKQEIQPEFVLEGRSKSVPVAAPVQDETLIPTSDEDVIEEAEVIDVEEPISVEYPVDMKRLSQSVIDGEHSVADNMTLQALEAGMNPEVILDKGLISGMNVVGALFKNNEIFVPEVLMSARAMKAGMAHLAPLLEARGIEPSGTFVIGTVKGDLHDIGKNLVAMMLRGAGFEVVDLGVDTSLDKFLETIDRVQPQIIGMSALLTTTMGQMARNIEAFEKMGLRSHLKIMVGGAPLSQDFAERIGADGYGKDAADAVEKAKKLVETVRAAKL